jgi:hypothetical protein
LWVINERVESAERFLIPEFVVSVFNDLLEKHVRDVHFREFAAASRLNHSVALSVELVVTVARGVE